MNEDFKMNEYAFSDRISGLQPSAIREILKATAGKNVIPFSAGNPSPETFPAKEMSAIAADIFRDEYATALQYGITEGYGPLREQTAARLKTKYNIGRDFDRMLITTGGQQVIELAAKVILNEGDTVICEDPSFIGALNSLRSFNAHLVGVPMDDEGILTDRVEEILRSDRRAKMIYVIPTFQNPSGRVMSLARRKKLLELAERYNVLILEDNPYYELRFAGNYVPSIKSLDENGRVIYAGSYSKILSPGMRIGFGLAPEAIFNKMTVAKQVSDVHTNLFFMMLVSKFLDRYDIDAHIARICELYSRKAELMCRMIDKLGGDVFEYIRPQGGLFLWLRMPRGNGNELARFVTDYGVAIVPGSAFLVNEKDISPCIRLNYSLPSEVQIELGIEKLCEATKTYLARID